MKIAALGLHPRGDMVATQIEGAKSPRLEGGYLTDLSRKTGAGEGIRTLDPNLGNLPVYLFDTFRYCAIPLFLRNLLKTFLT
ncbi:hypothetical protein [Sphingopyxis sp.]|uniref:hypothetical protein n=1 Tax=Sphingopyxis sp. TaxID=1908224 RepID=UPI002B4A7E83|nr:hypothetical protein [Sphingopyxis sp.]HJS11142.1 hypothetical protein [Sphingopyxis sp.]